MRQIAEENRLPVDVDAQPPVRAAAALRSTIRGYRDEIEREQQLPKALVEQFHTAGFFSATDSARNAMDLMYRHGGSTSFQRESRQAECSRDLHVVAQAVTLAPEWYPMGGRVLLNMDPGPRLR